MRVLAVDARAVSALQIGKDKFLLIVLDLDVKAADPLVIELDRVALFTTNRDGRLKILEDLPAVGPVQNSQRHSGHYQFTACPLLERQIFRTPSFALERHLAARFYSR